MISKEMYNALLNNYRYKSDGCYPSMRYTTYRDNPNEAWWAPIDDYSEIIKERKRKDTNMNLNDIKILVGGNVYKANDVVMTENYNEFPKLEVSAYLSPSNRTTATTSCGGNRITPTKPITIENVIFNPPATIVFWSDKTKTIVKADYEYESYDPEKGLAMAIAKKMMGDNKGCYYELFKHWRKKWDEQNVVIPDIKFDMPKSPIETLAEGIRKVFRESEPVSEPVDELNSGYISYMDSFQP